MTIETQLSQLFEVILKEIKTNNEFAKKIRGIFNADEGESHQKGGNQGRRENTGFPPDKPSENASASSSSSTPKRQSRKRNAALFNPETILETSGEAGLLNTLNQLDVDQLKEIVSEFGMDPAKRVMRWKKRERFVAHIMEVANHRVKKGRAFRG